MKIINIGILAHVDAGKTTLTESLLYTSGAIAEQGNVDKGTTRTDTMILERQRGITIQTAVTSFCWNDYKINIVDTPGHMDFLTEAYRSLSVLDGAVLVISAKDGVQAQTRILFNALQKMNILDIQPHFLLCACLRLHWEQGQGRLPALSVCFCGQFQTPESCVYPVPSKTQEPSWHECRCNADRNSVPVPSVTNDFRYFLPCGRVPRCS